MSAANDRQAALAERSAMVDRLRANIPAELQARQQWLMWKLELIEGREGLQKVPYYVNGSRRHGELGGADDLRRLATFDQALQRLAGAMHFVGVGFAFLEGGGLIGIDLDDMVDQATGELREHHRQTIEACSSYSELSPSGQGLHIIVSGSCDSFKHDPCGVEVYSQDRWFACTGAHYSGSPREVLPIKGYALAYLQKVVQDSKDRVKAEKAAAAAAAAPAAGPRPASAAAPAGAGGDDFRRVNDAALQAVAAWVPQIFPAARTWKNGYRIRSKDLGRELEEDLQITPEGIMDFGEERGMSPIDCVMQWQPGCATAKDALHWLAARVGIQLAPKPRAQLRAVPPAAPPAEDAPASDNPGGGTVSRIVRPGRKKSPRPPAGEGGGLTRLCESFRLIYGTDSVWDGEKRGVMPVKNLRLLFGNDTVRMWLQSADRKLLYQQDMVFEPGAEVEDHKVNLFDGLALEPEPCEEADVQVMLDLLRHLCSLTAAPGTTVDDVMVWVLRWLAYPLQYLGAKLRSALVFHGPQGTGKNLFFDCIRAMYGKYGRMVGQGELDDKFNDWLSAKMLIIGNEVVTRQELFHNKNKLKWIVTEDEIPIRGMHQAVRWERNCAQLVFLSNENMPLALERDDRRHLVVYTPVAGDEALYRRVSDFLASGGAAKFLYYLLSYDLGHFHEHTKPLMTEAKAALIDLGLKPHERFVSEWLQGYLDLPVNVCSAEQLYRVYRRWCDLNGERYPTAQGAFTNSVRRYVGETVEKDAATGSRLEPALDYKPIQLKHESGPRKAMRCWIPRGAHPPEGVTEGEWAAAAVDAFETIAGRFGRRYAGDDPD